MGATVEIYTTDENELMETFNIEDFDSWFEAKSAIPCADFSIQLQMPDDLDRLLVVMQQQGLEVPGTLAELIVRESWADGYNSAWIHLLDDKLKSFGSVEPIALDKIVEKWAAEFEIPAGARKALEELRAVCKHAVENETSLLLYTCY